MKYTIRYTEPGSTLVNIRTVEARTPSQAVDKVIPPDDIGIVFKARPRRKTRDFVTPGGFAGTVVEAKPTRYAGL